MDPGKSVGRRRAPSLAMARVMWAAMVGGVVAFLAVAVALPGGPAEPPEERWDLMFWIAVGVAGTLVPASWFARAAIHARAGDSGELRRQAWFTGHLVQWAMCEGAAFFGAVVTMMAVDKWPAAIPAVVGLVGLLFGFPTDPDPFGDAVEP